MKISKRILAVAMTGAMVTAMAVPSFAGSRAALSQVAAAQANADHEAMQAAWDAYVQAKAAAEAAAGIIDTTGIKNVVTSAQEAAQANGTVVLDPQVLTGGVVVKAPIYDSATAAALANAAHEALNN